MKMLLLTPILILYLFKLSAQKGTILNGKIYDSLSGKAISGTSIIIKETQSGCISDINGDFQIPIESFPVLLEISHVSYFKKELRVVQQEYIPCPLVVRPYELSEFTIYNIIKAVKDEDIYILDYDFTDSFLLVLGYYTRSNQPLLLLVNESGDTLYKVKTGIPYPALTSLCNNETGIRSGDDIYRIDIGNRKISFCYLYSVSQDGLNLSCEAIIGKYISSSFYISNQYKAFTCTGKDDSIFHYFHVIDNRNMLNQPSNWGIIKYESKKFNLDYLNSLDNTKVNCSFYNTFIQSNQLYYHDDLTFQSSISMNDNSGLLNLAYFKNVIDKPVYAPVFADNNNLILFDHANGKIIFFDSNLCELNFLNINYHKEKNWQNKMLFDSKTKKFYALFLRNGIYSLREIDMKSGKTNSETKIQWPYVSNIKLYNGYAYFLYRPDAVYSTSKCLKQLYKIRLN